MVPVFRAADVERAVTPHEAYDAVRDAFVAYARSEWTMPSKVYVENYPAGDFRAMPALGGGHAVLKWVTSFPGNPARGLPTVTGLVLLSDADDGRLLAVLDAAAVTALRTAAAGVLAADTLCRAEAASYAVVGCGVNGAETARMLVARGVTPLVWDVDEGRRRLVAERLGVPAAESAAEALACEVVVTVTPGVEVLYPVHSLEAGQHVSLMGADGPGKAEVAVEELGRAHLFCDDWEQASHGGEFTTAVEAGAVSREDVTELGAVLTGAADGRRSASDITLFDSTGLAIQDLAIAKAAYAKVGELDLQRLELSEHLAPSGEQARGLEEVEQRIAVAEDRARDQSAAGEAEHVPVPGVAAGDPDTVLVGRSAHDGQEVEDHPEDPGPAVLDLERAADMLLDESLERRLHHGCRDLVRRELGVERDVAKAAGDDAAGGILVPVVEAVAAVVRDLEQLLRDGLRRDHLAARRHDQSFELTEEPARVAVRGDDHGLRAGLGRRADVLVLADVDSGFGRTQRQPPHEPSGLQHSVGRMEDRRGIASGQRRAELLTPLDREACVPKRLELFPELLALVLVGGQTEAARVPEGVARERSERGELGLRPAPERGGRLGADRVREHGVRRRPAPQREAAVAAARATSDLPRLVEPDRETGLGERQRARAAGDAASDDGYVRHVHAPHRQRIARLREPVRGRRHGRRS